MTFDELRDEILLRARQNNTCDDYHKVLLSVDYATLIDNGISLLVWAYKMKVVDDALISEVPGVDLIAKGIYNAGITPLVNPADPVYIFPGAIINATVDGTNSCKFYLLGGELNITVQDTAKADVETYNNPTFTAIMEDNAVGCYTFRDNTAAELELNNSAVATVDGRNFSQSDLLIKNDSFVKILSWQHAKVDYTLEDAGSVSVQQNHSSKIENLTII